MTDVGERINRLLQRILGLEQARERDLEADRIREAAARLTDLDFDARIAALERGQRASQALNYEQGLASIGVHRADDEERDADVG